MPRKKKAAQAEERESRNLVNIYTELKIECKIQSKYWQQIPKSKTKQKCPKQHQVWFVFVSYPWARCQVWGVVDISSNTLLEKTDFCFLWRYQLNTAMGFNRNTFMQILLYPLWCILLYIFKTLNVPIELTCKYILYFKLLCISLQSNSLKCIHYIQ